MVVDPSEWFSSIFSYFIITVITAYILVSSFGLHRSSSFSRLFFFSFFIIPVETAEWHQNLPRVFAATLFFFFFMFFFFFIFCLLCTHTLKSVQSTTTALLFLFVYLFV